MSMNPDVLMIIALAAIFIGAWVRILMPFWRKNLQGEDLEYNGKYTLIFVIMYIMALVITVFSFQANPPNLTTPIGYIVLSGFAKGFTSEAIILEIAKLALPPGWWD